MPDCTSNHTFHNWAQSISCKPDSYCQPDTEAEVVEIIRQAIVKGKRVRTVGAGHSWAPLVLTRDVLINLDKLTRALQYVMPGGKAKVEGGMRLKHLISRLRDDQQLGLRNLGSITEQSIAGAISTGTHGTGLTLGNIGTQIISIQLVTGTGDIVTITELDKDALNAARLSLGALGIITQLTIQCVPDYNLESAVYWCKFNEIVDKMETLAQQNTRVKFWWLVPRIGSKDNVIMTTENPVGAAPASSASIEGLPMDTDGILDNLSGAASETHPILKYVGKYDQVLTIPLLPILHRECEYAIPMGKTAEALRAFKRAVEEGNLWLTLPVEVRFVGKDETFLSPANQRDVCYIGVATQSNANEVIQRFEPIMKRLGGRPHWGKCFSLTRSEAEALYPDYEKFRTIRKELDPNGIFSNEFLKYFFD